MIRAISAEVGLTAEPYLTNTTLCSPLDGTKPSAQAIAACRPRLIDEIARLPQAKLVLACGNPASQTLLSTKTGITQLEGALYTVPEVRPRILPTFNPAAVLRGADGYYENIESAFFRVRRIAQEGIEPTAINESKVPTKYYFPDTALQGLQELRDRLEAKGTLVVAHDLETDGLEYGNHQVLQFGIYDGETCWVFNIAGRQRLHSGGYGPDLPGLPPDALALYQALLRDQRITWWFHNQSFDLQFIRHWFGVHHRDINSRDTMCLALGLSEKSQHVGLGPLSRKFFNAQAYWEVLEKWFAVKDKDKRRFSEIPRDVLGKYLALDCIYTWHLIPELTKECETQKTGSTLDLAAMLMRYQRLFARMEYRGVAIDLEYVAKLRRIWYPYVMAARNDLAKAAASYGFDSRAILKGKPKKGQTGLNPGSPKQLMHLFYTLLKLRPVLNQKRKPTTGKEFLAKYKDHPLVVKLAEYRTVKRMMSTYVDGIAAQAWSDRRIRPDILVFGTVTGRLAIRNPPLQTIPKEKRLKVKFDSLRKLFIAQPISFEEIGDLPAEGPFDSILVEADYKQLEMRIAWHYSEDPLLGDALLSGDFHAFMATKIFKCRLQDVTEEMRHKSKFVTFGILYGRGAFSLAKGELNCSVQEAQAFIDNFFAAAPKLHQWWKDTQAFAYDKQYGKTTLGRVRRWGVVSPKNVQEVRNQSVNFPVQSLASDLNTLSSEKLYDILEKARIGYPLFPVHDAIMFEIRKDRLNEAIPHIERIMCDPPFKTCAKFEIDISVGPSWGELIKWTPQPTVSTT